MELHFEAKADTVSYSYLSMYIVPIFDIILIVFSLSLNMDVFIRVFCHYFLLKHRIHYLSILSHNLSINLFISLLKNLFKIQFKIDF